MTRHDHDTAPGSDPPAEVNNPFASVPCRKCGQAALRLELRPRLVARPLGTWSLAGAQDKTSAVEVQWPWCVCDNCGAESAGKTEGTG